MTEFGSDLSVSGRVRASQGSVEGDAVMLGARASASTRTGP